MYYEQFPWQLGYPAYAEIDAIFPFMLNEWTKKENERKEREMKDMERDAKAKADFEKFKREGYN